MKILDRYILRTYLINWAILLIVLMTIFVLIDLLVEVDEFVQAAEVRAAQAEDNSGIMPGKKWFWLLWTLADYYIPILLLMFTYLTGLIATAAIGFTFAILNRSGELLAMLTAGISMYRIAAPAILAGLFISAISLPVQEYIIPEMAYKILRSKQTMQLDTLESRPIYFTPDEDGNLLSLHAFDAIKGRMTNVSLFYRQEGQATGKKLTADFADWDPERLIWRLSNPKMEQVIPGQVNLKRTLFEEGFELKTSLTPDVLLIRRNSRAIQLLSFQDLNHMQANPGAGPFRASMLLTMHTRFSMVFIQALVLTLTLPYFLQREQGFHSLQAVKATVICLGAWVGSLLLIHVIGKELNPMAAAWLPVAIYLPLSALSAQTIRT